MRTAISLFHGMGCFNLALNLLDVSFDKIYVSEVDKFAIAEDKANHPNNIHMGDVTKWREWDINWTEVDLVVGGSPCQGFSSAGKQHGTKAVLNGNTYIVSSRGQYLYLKSRGAEFLSQSYLFWEYVLFLDWVKINNPSVKFMLENVKMSKGYLDMISGAIDCNPVFINSALMTAQNRQRFYWCNGDQEIPQPEDEGVMLKDILEFDGVGVLKSNGKFNVKNGKSNCIDANYFKGIDNRAQRTAIAFSYNRKDGFIKELEKAHPLNASDWRGLNRNQNQTAVVYTDAAIRGRRLNEKGIRDNKYPLTQCLEVSDSQKSMCLTTVPSKDCLVSNEPPGQYQDAYNRNDLYYRKLTVTEYCRLQTVPDDFFKVSSPTQAYKMLGNGWTVVVIAHILKHLLNVAYTA